MIDKSTIPAHWEVKKLGEVCEFEYGKALKKELRDETGKFDVFGSNGVVGKHSNFIVSEPSVIVGRKGAAGEVHLSLTPFWPIDTTYFIRQKSNYDLKFLYYQLKALQLNFLDKSTAIPGLNRNDAYQKSFVLPPLSEQQEIVAKIEELLSELDQGKQQLETARQQLKVYRQAVLKCAFESNKDKYEPSTLAQVSDKIQIGPFGSQLHKEDYIEGGIPLINPMHISGGEIVADNSYTISKEKRDSLPNYILREGDVIMGRRGEMGRCGLVKAKENGWFCGTGSLYVRPNQNLVYPPFLYFFLRSDTVKKYLEKNAGGTTMANLNLKIVNNIPTYLPTVEEQTQIVQEIESRLSVCDKVEETITQSLQQAETLRQSILKQAFEGKLCTKIN